MGFLVGFAEPAIHVMIKQVEELSEGRIRSKIMLMVISIGIGAAVGLSMWRLLVGFSLLFLDPRIRASIYFRTKSGQDLFSNGF